MDKNILLDNNKREYPIHLLQGFPVGVVENKFSEDTYDTINWHWHDELQYTLITKGKFLFKVGKQEIILKEGEGLFINSQKIHNSYALEKNSSYLFIYFHPTLIPYEKNTYLYKKYVSPILKNKNLSAIKLIKNLKESIKIFEILSKLKNISTKKEFGYEMEILSNLIELWRYTVILLENLDSEKIVFSTNDKLFNERLKNIISFVEENYNKEIKLENISKLVNLSKSECCRFFKKATKQTLNEYILAYRINKAFDEIINTDKSLAEISYDVGFNSQSYFSKKFFEIKNISPKEVRKKYEKNLYHKGAVAN